MKSVYKHSTDTLITIRNLKTYLKTGKTVVRAVDNISFHIDKGETFCIVGESGSGKSITALSIMQLLPNGISSHPEGSILFNHRLSSGAIQAVDLLKLPAKELMDIRGSRIAMIFQEPMTSLNPVFTIGEQIIEALQTHQPNLGYNEAREQAIEALHKVLIKNPEQRIDDYPHRLSGGQRQRVAIAMAIACRPDLLIADEPTTALDVTVQKEILQLMRDLQKSNNMGIVFITHDFGVVSQMADRLAVMHQGKIVETNTLKTLLKSPEHPYTQQLLDALPENLERQIQSAPEPQNDNISPLISLTGLRLYFPIKQGLFKRTVDHIKAVDGVDLSIDKSRIVALVGESGCGKTTLGRAILRLIEPTSGSITFSGHNITSLHRREMQHYRRRMQIIFQDPMSSLNPRLTIAGALTEPMAVHGIGESHEERLEIARQTLQRVQLDEDYLWRYPHEFSGGQRQRIGIARALVLKPDFIVCDEVTSALDVSVQAEILQMLIKLRQEEDLTLLFITHDIGVVEYISDETVVMNQGQIVEHGLTQQVCENPRHPYTQKLLAAVPRLSA